MGKTPDDAVRATAFFYTLFVFIFWRDPMRNFIQSLARDESGVTAVEYAILAAIVVGVLVAAGNSFGDALTTVWGRVTSGLTGAGAGTGTGS